MKENLDCSDCTSRENGVFAHACPHTMEQVSKEKTFLRYKKKDLIFKDGDLVKGFYCIQSGLIRIYKKTGLGKELTFGIKTRGHWLGFREVVSDIEFNHSAICLEEAEICFIPKETMQRLIKSDEVFQVEIMQYLANEWRIMENNIYSMGTKQIHSRLAELLITLYGISDRKDSEIHIKMSREIMATCIGTTKESLIRAMSDFRDRNWIRVEDNKIEIMNLEALYHLSEL